MESIFLAINDGSYYAAARPIAAAAATAVPRPPYELNRSYALCRLLHATMNSNIKTDTNSALNNSVENSTSPELSFTSHSAQKVISETFKLSLSLRFTLKKHNLTHKRKTRTKKLNEINTKKTTAGLVALQRSVGKWTGHILKVQVRSSPSTGLQSQTSDKQIALLSVHDHTQRGNGTLIQVVLYMHISYRTTFLISPFTVAPCTAQLKAVINHPYIVQNHTPPPT